MNRSINPRQIVAYSPLCFLVLLGVTLFGSPVAAQVFDSGPSDSALFDTVINVPPAPDIGLNGVVGGDGSTTQLNVSDGGSVERFFAADAGSEVNISGGAIGSFFRANSGSEVNISGGSIGSFFSANDSEVNMTGGSLGVGAQVDAGSVVNISGGSVNRAFSAGTGSVANISGGSIGRDFAALSGSEVHLVGSSFVLDGAPLDERLSNGAALIIVDRDVTLSGVLADGTAFSFDLDPNPPVFEPDGDYFNPDATLTVRRTRDPTVVLGDSGDGVVNFGDIDWFICILQKGDYLEAADINQDGFVNFGDIAPFIAILAGS